MTDKPEPDSVDSVESSSPPAAALGQVTLPCPFCGDSTGLYFSEGSTFRWLAFSCNGCGIGGEERVQTMGDGTPEEWAEQAKVDAIATWNTRAPALAVPVPPPAAPDGVPSTRQQDEQPGNQEPHP